MIYKKFSYTYKFKDFIYSYTTGFSERGLLLFELNHV